MRLLAGRYVAFNLFTMKHKIWIFSFLLSSLALSNQSFSQTPNVPTDRIMERTYLIVTDTLAGTCFSIDYNGQEYFITVRHLFKKAVQDSSIVPITIYYKKEIKKIDVTLFKPQNEFNDVVVLRSPIKTNGKVSYELGGSPMLGQDVYFIGYPTLSGNLFCSRDINGVIYPLIKKATYSGVLMTTEKVYLVLLDGHNNPGFSGSPVTYFDYFDNKYKITAIVSGYFLQENKIIGDTKNKYTNQENSGIIKCFDIETAIEILKRIRN